MALLIQIMHSEEENYKSETVGLSRDY